MTAADPAPEFAPDLGPRPELAWVLLDRIAITGGYQRQISDKRGQRIVRKIAAEFDWRKFQAPTLARLESAGFGPEFALVDGQHRIAAARLHPEIDEVPCYIVDAPDAAAQAALFVGINRDRVNMSVLALHYANLVAGDEKAQAIAALCAAAGVEVCRYPKQKKFLRPPETVAVGTIYSMAATYGPAPTKRALTLIRTSWPERPGQISADMIKALSLICRTGQFTDRRLSVALLDATAESLTARAARRAAETGDTVAAGLIAVIAALAAAADRPARQGGRAEIDTQSGRPAAGRSHENRRADHRPDRRVPCDRAKALPGDLVDLTPLYRGKRYDTHGPKGPLVRVRS